MHAAGIDAGTQSIKVLVYDSDRKRIEASASVPLPLIAEEGGVREQEASWWLDAIRECFASIDPDVRGRIDAISVSGQQHGFVPVASDGSVLSPVKLWCDTSTSEECREIEDAAGGREKLSSRLGNPILPGYTASKILHLKKAFPDLYRKMAYVMLPHDYINFYLSGEVVMERGDASGTGLMDIFQGKWDEEVCGIISEDLLSKLPAISPSPSLIGRIRKETALELGLPSSVMIASGGGDNMMSAIGTGAVRDGSVTMSLGTSGTLFASSSKPFHDRKNRLASFCSSHGTWLPLLCTMNCTVASEVMRSLFGLDVKAFDDKAEASVPGAGGLFLLPFFNGERVPDLPDGKGVLTGMTIGNATEENIARATLEGVTYGFLLGLDAFRENGMEVSSITMTGGGAKSRFWRQLASDMTGCRIRVPEVSEAAAFGAALQALWLSSGEDSIGRTADEHLAFREECSAMPDMSLHKEYEALYSRWLGYVEALSPVFS